MYSYIPGLVKARSYPFLSERLTRVSKKRKWKRKSCGIISELDALVQYCYTQKGIFFGNVNLDPTSSLISNNADDKTNLFQSNETYV